MKNLLLLTILILTLACVIKDIKNTPLEHPHQLAIIKLLKR